MKTIRVPVNRYKELHLEQFPSAGPGASIAGMKNLYWGKTSLVVQCGQYIYHVDEETYYTARAAKHYV